MTRLRLQVGDAEDQALETELREHLHQFNVDATGLDDGAMLMLSLREDDGRLVGGVCGWTWGGAAFVDLLWVSADFRGQGLGSQLLTRVEQEARSRGCRQVLLSTHGFQAPAFYAARGYREAGRFEDYPVGSYQVHLVKRLT